MTIEKIIKRKNLIENPYVVFRTHISTSSMRRVRRRRRRRRASIKFIISCICICEHGKNFLESAFFVWDRKKNMRKVKKSMLKMNIEAVFSSSSTRFIALLSVCLFNNSFIPGHHHSHKIYALFFSSHSLIHSHPCRWS